MEGVAAAEQVFTELERRRASGVGAVESEADQQRPQSGARSRSLQENTTLERRRASGVSAVESEADQQRPQSGARSRSLQENTTLERRRASGVSAVESEADQQRPQSGARSRSLQENTTLERRRASGVSAVESEADQQRPQSGARSRSLQENTTLERRRASGVGDGEAPHPAAPPPAPSRSPEGTSTAPWIRLDQVTLTYPGRDIPALDRADLVIAPGRSVLLMGPSGSGKSTLLSLLLRFLEPTSGRVLIREPGAPDTPEGWTPLDDVPPDQWRRRIAWVPQSPYLFDDTVAGNIRLGDPDAGMDAVRRAAELAEADAFIRALPQGYDTRLGERGARLSAGQRQRIAVARAFLRDAPVVLLDEPTAHLDPDNAAAVRVAVRRLLAERTGVVVAHDAHWADAVDEVVAVHAGHVETGVLS
ncbi:ATP-binding cassette domain-containing protein [Streptomonospora sp. NEAU-YY374]|nr:ATP-binding cassette domain-containing protein [Streptomonospora nanhaiensis]